jgi:hypothetical protein
MKTDAAFSISFPALLALLVFFPGSALGQTTRSDPPVMQTVGGDKVVDIYLCGNDVGIHMQKAGWLVVQEATVGAKRVDRILSVALTMMTTDRSPNWYDAGAVTSWCAVPNPRPITVFGIAAGS